MNEFKSLPRCKACGKDFSIPNYSGVHFKADKFKHDLQRPNAKGLTRWPMSLGSIRSLLLHEDVVKQLIKDEVQGVRFHEIDGIQGKVLDFLPTPPKYYKVEALGITDFFPDPAEFDLVECQCGIIPQKKNFNEFASPFEINENPLKKQDFFKIKHYLHWICVTKKVVDIIINNQWAEEFAIGSRALPGMQIKEFGENWYHDTLETLKAQFPNTHIPE